MSVTLEKLRALKRQAGTGSPAAPASQGPSHAGPAASIPPAHTPAANDGAAVTAITLPASVFTAIRPAPGGGTKISRVTVEEFVKNLRPGLHEAMWAPRVSIRGGMMATVTAPYEFKLEGKSTHCGIDVFELAKVDGQWKVASLTWTAEPEACPELKTQKAAG